MKFDFKSIFPAITAFIAFILTLLCLFAGSQKDLLDNADLLTVRQENTTTQTMLTRASYTLRKATRTRSITFTPSMSCHTARAL
jgi:hypothetical protein